tara:strand:- start:209 stop:436 length:228 start_codon:yes stop_codon:yes gene_type:complete
MAFKMKGMSFGTSPIKQDVDTSFVDKVYNKRKVDETLKKSGHHTEKKIRGKKDTDQGAINIGGGNLQLGASDLDI